MGVVGNSKIASYQHQEIGMAQQRVSIFQMWIKSCFEEC